MQNLALEMEQTHPQIQAEDDYLESSLAENDLGVLAGKKMKKRQQHLCSDGGSTHTGMQ